MGADRRRGRRSCGSPRRARVRGGGRDLGGRFFPRLRRASARVEGRVARRRGGARPCARPAGAGRIPGGGRAPAPSFLRERVLGGAIPSRRVFLPGGRAFRTRGRSFRWGTLPGTGGRAAAARARYAPARAGVIQGLPFGTRWFDTSEFMIGRVAVSILFPESDGSTDLNRYDWTPALRDSVVRSAVRGLAHWSVFAARRGVPLTFALEVHPGLATR